MTDAKHQPYAEGAANASVASAGEPHGSSDTRDLAAPEGGGPTPEELDSREEKLTGPRKPMGPPDRDDDDGVPETIPEES